VQGRVGETNRPGPQYRSTDQYLIGRPVPAVLFFKGTVPLNCSLVQNKKLTHGTKKDQIYYYVVDTVKCHGIHTLKHPTKGYKSILGRMASAWTFGRTMCSDTTPEPPQSHARMQLPRLLRHISHGKKPRCQRPARPCPCIRGDHPSSLCFRCAHAHSSSSTNRRRGYVPACMQQ
jgi:hypothetical protein